MLRRERKGIVDVGSVSRSSGSQVYRAHVSEAAVVVALQSHALLRGGLVQGHTRVEEKLSVLHRQLPQLAPHVAAW